MGKDKNVMKISKEKAVRVFEHFGFKTAAKWTPEKMTEKLNTLVESIDSKVKIKSKKVKALVAELVAAEKIVVSGGKKKEKDTPKAKDKSGKGKGKKDKAEKKTKKSTSKRISRFDAAVKVLTGLKKSGTTVEDGKQASDGLYVEGGGVSNLNTSGYAFDKSARVLELVELVVFSEDRKTVKPA